MQDEFGLHTVTGRATTEFRLELSAGDLVIIDCSITRIGSKSCTFLERMRHVDTGVVHATYLVSEVFFDPQTRKAVRIPDPIRAALEPLVSDSSVVELGVV